jgi:hypothetical protein
MHLVIDMGANFAGLPWEFNIEGKNQTVAADLG